MMKLFEVTNGYVGESYVRVYVIAENDRQAIVMAREAYKREIQSKYQEEYYTNLSVSVMCEDTSMPYISRVMD